MIDRNIRKTRSADETKKAHRRAILTAVALFVLFLAVNRVQKIIRTAFIDTGAQLLGRVLAVCAGIIIVCAVIYLVYKYGKSREKRSEE